MLEFIINCKFSACHFFPWIFGGQNLAANSAYRNVTADFQQTKILRRIRRMATAEGCSISCRHLDYSQIIKCKRSEQITNATKITETTEDNILIQTTLYTRNHLTRHCVWQYSSISTAFCLTVLAATGLLVPRWHWGKRLSADSLLILFVTGTKHSYKLWIKNMHQLIQYAVLC